MSGFDTIRDLPTTVLDNLPLGISVQDRNFNILYQNEFSKEIFNQNGTTTCFERFEKYEEYGNNQCKDCPLKFTSIDQKPHSILRKMIDPISKEDIYFDIKHQPILNQDGGFDIFVEIINQVTQRKVEAILHQVEDIDVYDDIFLSITNFGDYGGEIQGTSLFETFQTEIDTNDFILKLSQFWFIAISQGENWPDGLFGPLPVFDHEIYDSYAYSFRIDNPEMKDVRFAGEDVGMIIIIVRKANDKFHKFRQQILDTLRDVIKRQNNISSLSKLNLEELREEIQEIQHNEVLPIELRILDPIE